jgi:hypothetical protein
MNFSKWLEIESDYEAAKECLWCPREAGEWHRVDAKGHFHLWKAYYAATQEDEKQDLIYARILIMMADEDRENCFNNYIRFHRYIAPAKDAYERAIQNNEAVCDKEYEKLIRTYNYLKYMLDMEDGSDESYSMICGLNEIEELFCFHDAKTIRFEHIGDTAEIDIKYYDVTVRLIFKGIFDIQINTDPICDYINEFYCYKHFDIPERIVFDIGFYKIVCEQITAEKI